MSRKPIVMPSLSDTMKEGHLRRWLKQPGDPVHKGEALAEIESDKAVMDLEAFSDGFLAGPLAKEDADYPVGATLAYLSDVATDVDEPGEAADTESTPQAHEETSAAVAEHKSTPAPKPGSDDQTRTNIETASPANNEEEKGRPLLSPYARALAQDLGLDPEMLARYFPQPIKSTQVIAAAMGALPPDLSAGPPLRYKWLTPMRRSIADHMTAAAHIPTFRVSARLPVGRLQTLARERSLSFTLLMARALAQTVELHPRFNDAYTPLGLAQRKRVDVGIAVDIPGGLVTPVLRDAASRSLDELGQDWLRLKQQSLQQKLSPEDYQGATIYLSNLGMFPHVRRFDAIVPLGASAILALGAADQGQVEATLSADHRVVYGADAARFLESLSEQLDQPEGLLKSS